MVEFPSNGSTARGYLAEAAGGRGPGVIVIQEWWGLVDHIKHVADRFAREGFTALAPDVYHGESASGPDDAGRLMMALDIQRAARDLAGATKYLLAQPSVSSQRVAAIGFCMGGQLALAAACKNREIGAVADFYGIHPNVELDLDGLAAPVLGIFAERDAFVTPEAARRLEKDLIAAGKQTDFTIFPNVDHAFFNDSRADVYDARAAQQAWAKTLAFFRSHV
jgi:carboxymethylenebutenolidase